MGQYTTQARLGEPDVTKPVDEWRDMRILASSLGVGFQADAPEPLAPLDPLAAFRQQTYRTRLSDGQVGHVRPADGLTLAELIRQPKVRGPVVLVPRQVFIDVIMRTAGPEITQIIATPWRDELSARQLWPTHLPGRKLVKASLVGLLAIVLVGLLVWFDPRTALILPPLLFAPVFIIAAITVLACLFGALRQVSEVSPLDEADLPRYTVLVPIYREANILPQLIERLSAIQYPRDRLEILILAEADDAESRTVLAALDMPYFINTIVVPSGEPRTKPRALNAGLMVATGDLVVVFDAEDRPEPDQLALAAALFAASSPLVACVQARLAIANVQDCLITRRFAIDYAALFDCGKSGMARLDWPVPLGGSSNHFRTRTLRELGGWDAWNVTEDADLGIRLARMGYFVADLPSTTWEEAPNRLASWMNQRTRWMKGWMQTLLVHARHPAQLIADLGAFRTIIVSAFGFSVVFGALLFPVFVAGLIWRLADGMPLGQGPALSVLADIVIVECLALGLLAEILPAVFALRKRRALRLLPWILLAPMTYVLTVIAAWRAVIELVRRPHHWHKTSHGEARTEGGLFTLR